MDELKRAFAECDKNDDGQLSVDECADRWGEDGEGKVFADVDTNGDGQVTWSEMAHAILDNDGRINLASKKYAKK